MLPVSEDPEEGGEMMNQATNLVQWKNLTQEQKDAFDFENYRYEFQNGISWTEVIPTNPRIKRNSNELFRLVIEDDKWYYCKRSVCIRVYLGKEVLQSNHKYCKVLRPARPDEIPQPEKTLEQKIQDKWPEHGVVMLVPENGILRIVKNVGACEYDAPHIYAQSMKGFYKYVYVNEGGGLYIEREPTDYCENTGKTLQPVAGLFERSEG